MPLIDAANVEQLATGTQSSQFGGVHRRYFPTGNGVPIRRIFFRGCTSGDYALLSPCVPRYGYRAPRVACDENSACYVLWDRSGDMSRTREPDSRSTLVAFVERVTRSTATARNSGERGEMCL